MIEELLMYRFTAELKMENLRFKVNMMKESEGVVEDLKKRVLEGGKGYLCLGSTCKI